MYQRVTGAFDVLPLIFCHSLSLFLPLPQSVLSLISFSFFPFIFLSLSPFLSPSLFFPHPQSKFSLSFSNCLPHPLSFSSIYLLCYLTKEKTSLRAQYKKKERCLGCELAEPFKKEVKLQLWCYNTMGAPEITCTVIIMPCTIDLWGILYRYTIDQWGMVSLWEHRTCFRIPE